MMKFSVHANFTVNPKGFGNCGELMEYSLKQYFSSPQVLTQYPQKSSRCRLCFKGRHLMPGFILGWDTTPLGF